MGLVAECAPVQVRKVVDIIPSFTFGFFEMIGVRGLATGTAYVKSVRMCVRMWVLWRGSGGPLGN